MPIATLDLVWPRLIDYELCQVTPGAFVAPHEQEISAAILRYTAFRDWRRFAT